MAQAPWLRRKRDRYETVTGTLGCHCRAHESPAGSLRVPLAAGGLKSRLRRRSPAVASSLGGLDLSITASNRLILAIAGRRDDGPQGRIWTSIDGTSWSLAATLTEADPRVLALAATSNGFVIAGLSGSDPLNESLVVRTSVDGATWSTRLDEQPSGLQPVALAALPGSVALITANGVPGKDLAQVTRTPGIEMLGDDHGRREVGRQAAHDTRQGIDAAHQQPWLRRLGPGFADQAIASAILDRLLHHATVVNIKGQSYRMRAHVPSAREAAMLG
jgi:hypothetical protein